MGVKEGAGPSRWGWVAMFIASDGSTPEVAGSVTYGSTRESLPVRQPLLAAGDDLGLLCHLLQVAGKSAAGLVLKVQRRDACDVHLSHCLA